MKTIYMILGTFVLLCCTACDLLNPIFNPQKEFIFPLAVGNKWVYDYSFSSRLASGTETWEVIKKENVNNGTRYTLTMVGEGTATFPQTMPYSYQFDMTVLTTSQYYVFQYGIAQSDSPDTIPRFSANSKDTVSFTYDSGTNISTRSYVNKIGHVYFYDYSGSPGSGRSGVKRKLRSYTFK